MAITDALDDIKAAARKNGTTCEQCLRRVAWLWKANKSPQAVFEVGNTAKPAMGHRMYFAHSGRVALCVAPERPEGG